MSDHKRFIGSGHWVNRLPEFLPGIGGQVNRYYTDRIVAVLRGDSELVLDFEFGAKHYDAQLALLADGTFSGSFAAREGGRSWQGAVGGRLFHGTKGSFFYGTWMEDPATGIRDTFWLDLLPDHSASEHSRFVDDSLDFITIVPPPDATPPA